MQILIILLIVIGLVIIGANFFGKKEKVEEPNEIKDTPVEKKIEVKKEDFPVIAQETVPTSSPSFLGKIETPKEPKKEKAPKKEKSISKEGGAKRGRKPKSKGDDLLLS